MPDPALALIAKYEAHRVRDALIHLIAADIGENQDDLFARWQSQWAQQAARHVETALQDVISALSWQPAGDWPVEEDNIRSQWITCWDCLSTLQRHDDLDARLNAFRELARRHPGKVAVQIGFNEVLAHLIEAGIDAFLMPSRFEPCGLNQMYSLRYGTPPIVRATGGLADTVIDAADKERGNGFVFERAEPAELLATVRRAAELWARPRLWRQLQKNGMAADNSWDQPAQRYIELYRTL